MIINIYLGFKKKDMKKGAFLQQWFSWFIILWRYYWSSYPNVGIKK